LKKQYTPSLTDAAVTDEPQAAPMPRAPSRARLINKAGAGATPLEKDVDAWLKIGWHRA
tara:strand:+ start:1034 stop:1210 length:177 start_codon:yes stop_codon:yes gene_type:complete